MTVSTSTDASFTDLVTHEHLFDRIVFPDDPARFIHVPTSPALNAIEISPAMRYMLEDIGINVSTGPVVNFRMKSHLRNMPGPGTVPLLYPGHFSSNGTTWPIEGMKKPNAIERAADTQKYLTQMAFIVWCGASHPRRKSVGSWQTWSIQPPLAMYQCWALRTILMFSTMTSAVCLSLWPEG